MNNTRREAIKKIIKRIEDISTDVEIISEKEKVCRDNLPENLHGSERYEIADSTIYNLLEAVEKLDSVKDSLEAAME